jgi:hypothetical protein
MFILGFCYLRFILLDTGEVHLLYEPGYVITLYIQPHRKGATYSWSRALLEKPPIVQLLENFPAFYGTRRFITAFT